ncbi:hypothetical protein ES708_05593 [subsurface metagenome]
MRSTIPKIHQYGHTFITDIEVEKIIFCLPKKTEAIKK